MYAMTHPCVAWFIGCATPKSHDVCTRLLQCVAVCCSVLQEVYTLYVCCTTYAHATWRMRMRHDSFIYKNMTHAYVT